ncbi:DUF2939 domain-containing protein [Xylophilus sp. ASV27]|uniref:DUF2939 domain-containing protein n=1 Tax=Xylophilus sp. ASV27 TaxID=2795129 RepID=UPI0018EC2C31|nr:DUF2939 domain-containing protein [Xylophilus sp. ASV27]
MRTKVVIGAAVACAAVAGLLYASPYLALRSIAKAVDNKDPDTVSEYVDFPALRESVKGQMLIKMQAEMQKPEMQDNPFAGFGQILAAGMINQLAETLVSPAGVMLMLEKGKPGKSTDVAAAGAGVDTQGSKPRPDYAVNYRGWSKVFVHPKGEQGGFVFKRDGLMGWKLVAVKMD